MVAVGDDLHHGGEHRRILADVGDAEFQVPHFESVDDGVAFLQRAAERLLHVDVAARFGRGDEHVVMLVDPAGADGDDVEFLLGEHVAVAGVGGLGVVPLLRGRPAGFIRIGHGDDLDVAQFEKRCIDRVAVVTPARVTDDADPVFLGHDSLLQDTQFAAGYEHECTHFEPVR